MESVNRDQLYTDLLYRFQYVSKFVDFGEEDKKLIHDAASYLAPLVPTVVNAVYTKLFSFDITKKHFAQKMESFEGKVVESIEELSQDSEQIKFRKDMLSKYLVKLVSADYNEAFVKYLDWVALIHTKTEIKRSSINVEYIHINALLGYVENILIGAISESPLENTIKKKTLLAFNKLIWIQNDLFAQYYVYDGCDLPNSRAKEKKVQRPSCTKNPLCKKGMLAICSSSGDSVPAYCKHSVVAGVTIVSLCVGAVAGYMARKH